ncbi:MAG: putative ABC transporter permease [Spirochaetia bacterium]|nr:putative ABC transporter permease [Spirochaetia bacterium]
MRNFGESAKNLVSEAFIWMLLSTLTEVWVTATVERISLGQDYIMSRVPFWSLQGHTTMWQWTVGIGATVGLRFFFRIYRNLLTPFPILKKKFVFCFIVMLLIYLVELLSGLFFNKFLGFDLWDYSQYVYHGIPLNLWGQITIVYAPFWFLAGYLVGPVYKMVHSIAPYAATSATQAAHELI